MEIGRREFFRIAAAGLVSLATGCASFPKVDRDTGANKILRQISRELIPGIGGVFSYEDPDAEQLLVHLMTMHSDPLFAEKVRGIKSSRSLAEKTKNMWLFQLRKEALQVNAVQRDWYYALDFLSENGLVNEVFLEGYHPGILEVLSTPQNIRKVYLNHLDDIDRSGLFPEVECVRSYQRMNHRLAFVEEAMQKGWRIDLQKSLGIYDEVRRGFEHVRYIPGAVFLLAMEGKIKILPGESAEAHETRMRALDEGNGDDSCYANEDAEDSLLAYVKKRGKVLNVVEFGYSHSFAGRDSFPDYDLGVLPDRNSIRDNIHASGGRISLVEAIPTSIWLGTSVKRTK